MIRIESGGNVFATKVIASDGREAVDISNSVEKIVWVHKAGQFPRAVLFLSQIEVAADVQDIILKRTDYAAAEPERPVLPPCEKCGLPWNETNKCPTSFAEGCPSIPF